MGQRPGVIDLSATVSQTLKNFASHAADGLRLREMPVDAGGGM
jgi:hypothetical protein